MIGHLTGIARDQYGNVSPSASVYVYLAGTTTLASLYSDAALATPIANPMTADASGVYSAFLATGLYKVGPSTALIDNVMVSSYTMSLTRVERQATQAGIADSTPTAVSFDAEILDPLGLYDAGSPTRLTFANAGLAGWWCFYLSSAWASGTATVRQLYMRINGIGNSGGLTSAGAGTTASRQATAVVIQIVAGDYAEMIIGQTSGGPLDLSTAKLSAIRLSP